MAKMFVFFLVLLVIQAVLLMFNDPTEGNNLIDDSNSTALWNFASNVQNWNSTNFVLLFLGISLLTGISGIVAGSVFGFKTDFIVFATAVGSFIAFGAVMIQLANVFNNIYSGYLTRGAPLTPCNGCAQANLLVIITLSPLALYYIWTVIQWWRGMES